MYKLDIECMDFILEMQGIISIETKNLSMNNVDGNNMHIFRSGISNQRGRSDSLQKNSRIAPHEVVHMFFDLNPSIETSSECGILWASNSKPPK